MNPLELAHLNTALDDFIEETSKDQKKYRFTERERVDAVYEAQFIQGKGERNNERCETVLANNSWWSLRDGRERGRG